MYNSNSFCLFLTGYATLNGLCNYSNDSTEVKGHPAGIKSSIVGRNLADVEHELILMKPGPFLKKLTALREEDQRKWSSEHTHTGNRHIWLYLFKISALYDDIFCSDFHNLSGKMHSVFSLKIWIFFYSLFRNFMSIFFVLFKHTEFMLHDWTLYVKLLNRIRVNLLNYSHF